MNGRAYVIYFAATNTDGASRQGTVKPVWCSLNTRTENLQAHVSSDSILNRLRELRPRSSEDTGGTRIASAAAPERVARLSESR